MYSITFIALSWKQDQKLAAAVAFESSALPSYKLAVQHLPGSRSSGNHPLSAGTRTTT